MALTILADRVGTVAEADQPSALVVNEEVYQALVASADGRAHVIILLDDSADESLATLDERMAIVHDRQQALLDIFGQGEFELVHRPQTVARLTGRINTAGLAKLAGNSLVREVGLDVMNCGIGGECPPGTDSEALVGTSWFVLTSLFAPPAVPPDPQPAPPTDSAPRQQVALEQASPTNPQRRCGTQGRWAISQAQGAAPEGGGCPTQGACDEPLNRDGAIPDGDSTVVVIRLKFNVFCDDLGNNCVATQQDVDAQLRQLNDDYRASRIQFVAQTQERHDSEYRELPLIDIPPVQEETNMKTYYNDSPGSQLNIYVVAVNPANYASTYWGVGTFPWDTQALGAQGGITMWDQEFGPGKKTLTHEVGHCLGLWHTFRGVAEVGGCPDGCSERAEDYQTSANDVVGDFCSDTPPTPEDVWDDFGCAQPSGSDACSTPPVVWADLPTMPENYMSYASDACYDRFTPQQMGRDRCWIDADLGGGHGLFDWVWVRLDAAAPAYDWIDPLTETDDTGTPRIDTVTLTFDRPVYAWDGGALDASDVTVACTDAHQFSGNPCPGVSSVDVTGNPTVVVTLDGDIPYGEWTKISINMENASGVENTFVYYVAHLPDDTNQDQQVNLNDATRFGQLWNGSRPLELMDVDRNGDVNVNDATMFGELWNGTNNFHRWQGDGLPARP